MFARCIAAYLVLMMSSVGARPLDQARLLESIAQKEVGGIWDGRPGPCGELSRYQISFAVWIQHSREPFAEARNEAKARAVALKHLAWLRAQIAARHQGPSVERIATCWHFGAGHAGRKSEWGELVANLYRDPTWMP